MDLDALVARFPRLWHATFPGGWDGMRSTGIRSSLDLLTSAGQEGEADVLRSDVVTLSTPHGEATLRDQTPNRPDPAPYLDGITVPEWFRLLNSRSYFFVDREDLDKLVDSCLERGLGQEVITFETRRLLGPVADDVQVTTVSAGVFPRASGPSRGPKTFPSLAEFTGPVIKIKEVTITVPVTISDRSVVSVVRRNPGEGPSRIWPPPRSSAPEADAAQTAL